MKDSKRNVTLIVFAFLALVLIVVLCALAVMSKNSGDKTLVATATPMPTSADKTPTYTTAPTANYTTTEETELDYGFLKLENNEKNEIYSPLSIKYALKMLEEGANGNTKLQIENLTKNLNLTKYTGINKVMSLANCIYVRDTYKEKVYDEYKNTLINKYNAEINYDEFKDATNVNNWIENKTLGIIKNMISDSLVQDEDTEMLIINALAIDMEWQKRFDGNDTVDQDFILASGNKMKVKMMHNETSSAETSYYKDNSVTVLSMDLLKYENVQLEFMAIMPNNNLKEYINSFTQSKLDNITNNLKSASETKDGVQIQIPRFSFEYDLELKEDLQKMGIIDAFNSAADFSNISETGLGVSDAIHRAHIDFTEKGVKAAAVTVFLMADGMMLEEPKQPEKITIDKPFLFVIRDKSTGEMWFVGTVYEPEASNDTLQ